MTFGDVTTKIYNIIIKKKALSLPFHQKGVFL